MATERQPKNYKLVRRGAEGKSVETIDAGARIVAEPGVVYSLVDAASGAIVSDLRVTRAGDDLLVQRGDEPIVTVAGFFALGGTGTAFEMPTLVADASGFELAAGDSLVTPETPVGDGASAPLASEAAAGPASAPPAQNAYLGLMGLGLAGAASQGGGQTHRTWVVVDESGAYIDRNRDGRLDDRDRTGGQWVAADFASGQNADLAAKAVTIMFSAEPTLEVMSALSGLGADDSLTLLCSENVAARSAQLDVSASAIQSLLDLASSHQLKVGMSVDSSAVGATATLTLAPGPLSGTLAEVHVTASAQDSASTLNIDEAEGTLRFGDDVTVVASGVGSFAAFDAFAKGLFAFDGDITLRSSGGNALANFTAVNESGDVDVAGNIDLLVDGGRGIDFDLSTRSGDVNVEGTVSAIASAAGSLAVTLYPRDGNVHIGAAFLAQAEGADTRTSVFVRCDQGALTLDEGMFMIASGAGAAVSSVIIANDPDGSASPLTHALAVDMQGALYALASGDGSTVKASVWAGFGDLHVGGGIELTASGASSRILDEVNGGPGHFVSIRAAGGDLIVDHDVMLQASGNGSIVNVALSAVDGLLQIEQGLIASASGADSELHAAVMAANIVVQGDVQARAFGAGSTLVFDWGLLSGATPTGTLIDGDMTMIANSGGGDAAGAALHASIALTQLAYASNVAQGVSGGFLVDAKQPGDQASVDLALASFGGLAVLGSASSAGSASLNFVGLLASDIRVGFADNLGKATIGVQLDAADDATLGAQEIMEQIAVVSGFRSAGAHDQLEFSGLKLGSADTISYGSLSALVDAAEQALDGTTQVFAGRFDGDTYIAFDLDGDGFTGMIELDGVDQQQASYLTSTGAVG